MTIDIADDINPLKSKQFVNENFLPKAIKFCNNP